MQLDGFVIAHATPVWPEGLAISRVVDYLRDENLYWTQLFPSLQRSEEARWAAFAELDALSIPLFFHGHTHVQEAWCWAPPAAPRRVTPEPGEIRIAEGERWLVGVGSARIRRFGHRPPRSLLAVSGDACLAGDGRIAGLAGGAHSAREPEPRGDPHEQLGFCDHSRGAK